MRRINRVVALFLDGLPAARAAQRVGADPKAGVLLLRRLRADGVQIEQRRRAEGARDVRDGVCLKCRTAFRTDQDYRVCYACKLETDWWDGLTEHPLGR